MFEFYCFQLGLSPLRFVSLSPFHLLLRPSRAFGLFQPSIRDAFVRHGSNLCIARDPISHPLNVYVIVIRRKPHPIPGSRPISTR